MLRQNERKIEPGKGVRGKKKKANDCWAFTYTIYSALVPRISCILHPRPRPSPGFMSKDFGCKLKENSVVVYGGLEVNSV